MRKTIGAIVALAVAASTEAATFNVTTLADNGPGSLRDAIQLANAAPGADTITFGVTGTITLGSLLNIHGPVTIQGPGAANLAISGDDASQIFVIGDAPFTNCPATSGPSDYAVSISGLTLRNGRFDFTGGAIQTWHSLALDSVVVHDSRARVGGAIAFLAQYTGQSLTITHSELRDNRAVETPAGSGRMAGGAVAVIDYCASPDPASVTVTISHSSIHGNRVQPTTGSGFAGALLLESLAEVTITDTRIYDNHADAATTPAPGNASRGGAARFTGRSLRIERSEVAQNTAQGNSAFQLQNFDPARQGPANASTVRFINSTIADNAALGGGSSILVFGNVAVEFVNSTYAHNLPNPGSGGNAGLFFGKDNSVSAPTLKLESSILFNPAEGGLDIVVDGSLDTGLDLAAQRSLIGAVAPFEGQVNLTGSGNLLGLDPALGPLAFNGGLTRTRPLTTASPAIDAGSNPLALTVDQRGGAFVRVQGPAPDMGAVEYPSSCAGLTDVDPASPFCAFAGWIKNRGVTQGCAPLLYCPSADVIRVSMAAFMQRLASPLAGTIVGRQEVVGALDPDAAEPIPACLIGPLNEIPAAKFPRRAYIDAVFNATAASTLGLELQLVGAFDWGGSGVFTVATTRGVIPGARWGQLRVVGDVDLPAGQPLGLALFVARAGLPGTATLADGSCHLRVRLASRDGTSPPFDGAGP